MKFAIEIHLSDKVTLSMSYLSEENNYLNDEAVLADGVVRLRSTIQLSASSVHV